MPGSEAQGADTKEVAATQIEGGCSGVLSPVLTMRTDPRDSLDMVFQELIFRTCCSKDIEVIKVRAHAIAKEIITHA